uniref:Uncharacterized protein n=1 Tax=Mycena chlorophos TaxID=658473 RepID=A0ABQ0LMA1_MYCCL|nr:predicted protein [Mycena chlorophos]
MSSNESWNWLTWLFLITWAHNPPIAPNIPASPTFIDSLGQKLELVHNHPLRDQLNGLADDDLALTLELLLGFLRSIDAEPSPPDGPAEAERGVSPQRDAMEATNMLRIVDPSVFSRVAAGVNDDLEASPAEADPESDDDTWGHLAESDGLSFNHPQDHSTPQGAAAASTSTGVGPAGVNLTPISFPYSVTQTSAVGKDDGDSTAYHTATEGRSFLANGDYVEEESFNLTTADSSIYHPIPEVTDETVLIDLMLSPQEVQNMEERGVAVTSRRARMVEVAVALNPQTTLTEVVFDPNMARSAIQYVLDHDKPGKDTILERVLTAEQVTRLTAGYIVNNCMRKNYRECDNQHQFCSAEGHFTCETCNIIVGPEQEDEKCPERLYPHGGTAVVVEHKNRLHLCTPDVGFGTVPETVEIKTEVTINSEFIFNVLGITKQQLLNADEHEPTNRALLFAFQSARGEGYDKINVPTQVIVQLWVQLCSLEVAIAQASSHGWTFFALRCPDEPNRMYISHCMPTFNSKPVPNIPKLQQMQELGSEVGLVVMTCLTRIASEEALREDFLQRYSDGIRGTWKNMHYRDGRDEPPSIKHYQMALRDASTVGIRYSLPDKDVIQLRKENPRGEVVLLNADDSVVLPKPPKVRKKRVKIAPEGELRRSSRVKAKDLEGDHDPVSLEKAPKTQRKEKAERNVVAKTNDKGKGKAKTDNGDAASSSKAIAKGKGKAKAVDDDDDDDDDETEQPTKRKLRPKRGRDVEDEEEGVATTSRAGKRSKPAPAPAKATRSRAPAKSSVEGKRGKAAR